VDAKHEDAGRGRPTRRSLLLAAGGAALLAACGGDESRPSGEPSVPGSGPVGKARRRGERPGGTRPHKTTKKVHPKAQASASRSKGPLPSDLDAYVARKVAGGALVRHGRSNVVHHPVLCKKHLPAGAPKSAHAPRPAPASPMLHRQYADGILYALIREEKEPNLVIGLALNGALAWPVSARLSDLAIRTLRSTGKDLDDATAVSAALASAAAGPMSAEALRRRTDEALAVLLARRSNKGRTRKPR
jgi:hypothetical protein